MSSIELGATIVDALVGTAVRHVVLAPGSRSAALALALDRADKAGQVRLHVRVDERVAAFTALGIAKESGRPVAVVTTSGTATANLAPAAMEARAAGIPLLFITADRPAHFVGSGASQTTDQVGVLGPSGLGVVRLSSESGDAAAWASGVHRAVSLAGGWLTKHPGPVQLNVEFAVPLVGHSRGDGSGFMALPPTVQGATFEVEDTDPTVVLVGDAPPEVGRRARALAEAAGAPLLAEPSSNARFGACAIAAYRDLLDGPLGAEIKRVVVFGHPTLSRPVARLLSRTDVDILHAWDGGQWTDPGHRATVVGHDIRISAQDAQWLARWRLADERRSAGPQQFVADSVLAALSAHDDLMIGSSSIIRAADLSPIAEAPPRAFANRGVAGIDGTISTATGIALASGRPMTVLLGDLTVQHDLGALVRPTLEPWPDLRVVVADDDGGSIFPGLEQGAPEYADSFERVFGTPPGVDLVAVAASLGWRAVRVNDAENPPRGSGLGRRLHRRAGAPRTPLIRRGRCGCRSWRSPIRVEQRQRQCTGQRV